MTLLLPPPTVEGVEDGALDFGEFPDPAITLKYQAIDKSHTVSVMWEIDGADRSIYCCVLASQPPNSSSLRIKAWDEYTAIRSPGCDIRVWYSVSTEGGALEYSKTLEFHGVSPIGPPPGNSYSDLAVREALAQYTTGHFVIAVDLNTDSIGGCVTLYATWSTMGSRERCITWGKVNDTSYLWQSEFKKAEPDLDGKLRPVVFEIPKKELLKLGGRIGQFALRAEEGSTATPRTILASIDYVESKGAGTAWPPESGATKLTPESQRG